MRHEITADLDHGVLFISSSKDAIIENYRGERVLSNDSCIAVSGQHEVDGPVKIVMTDESATASDQKLDLLFRRELRPTGRLFISTADKDLFACDCTGAVEIRSDQRDATIIEITVLEPNTAAL